MGAWIEGHLMDVWKECSYVWTDVWMDQVGVGQMGGLMGWWLFWKVHMNGWFDGRRIDRMLGFVGWVDSAVVWING